MQRSDRPDEAHRSASSTIDAPRRLAERRGVTTTPDAVAFISTYNHARFVRQSVESVLEQRTRFDVRNPDIAIAWHNALICDDDRRLQSELYYTASQWLSCARLGGGGRPARRARRWLDRFHG